MKLTHDAMDVLAAIARMRGITPSPRNLDAFYAHLFSQQRALVTSPHRFKCTRAGRRAGKSVALAYWLAAGWETRPGQVSCYIARTRGHARDIIWDALKDLNDSWKWGAVTNEMRLEMRFPNGYQIWLRGAENVRQAEKLRGCFYWRVAIDEAHLYPDFLLRHLWFKVIRPLLADLMGECIFSGTPGYELDGLWFHRSLDPEEFPDEAEKGGFDQWPTFSWDMRVNPFLPDPEGEWRGVLEESGWTEDDPDFVREWRGQWVRNATQKCYDVFAAERNTYLEEDFDDWDDWVGGAPLLRTVIGVDIGWEDGCGFAVAQKRADGPGIRVREAFREVEMDDTDIARALKRLMRKYKTRFVFVDSKGNKNTCMSLRAFGVPAQPAVGGEKRPRIEYVRALLKSGNVRAHAQDAIDLIGDWQSLPWGYKRTVDVDGNQYMTKVGHKEGFVDECADAVMNALMMFSQQFIARLDKEPPKPGDDGYTEHVEQEERERLEARKRARDGERGGQKRKPRRRKKRG